MRRFAVRFALVVVLIGTLGSFGAAPSSAAPTVDGREWRELYQTTGLSWSQVASVCPTDGATPCAGTVGGKNLTGWTWATADQVRDLMDDHAPGLTTAEPPVVSGIDGFWGAISFLGVMRWTTYTSSTYSYSESTSGWTASKNPETGLPISGVAAYSHRLAGSTATGTVGLGTDADTASSVRGVFLWRPAGDYSAPVITPTVTGTLGNNGWYRSDVSVSWSVTDAESEITSTQGCDPSTLSADSGASTYACTATSAGGPGSGSVTVKRDTAPPTVTCGAAPTFELGQFPAPVTATVADTLSGPVAASVGAQVSTTSVGTRSVVLTGVDRAGNTRSVSCGYSVVVPKCQGKVPTILGTAGNDVITGTSGIDVVHSVSGADKIDGLGGADIICGGEGPDVIKGGAGADTVDGGGSNDDVNGGDANDILIGGLGSDSIRGDGGTDRCSSGEVRMSSCETVF